jgi:protein-tyrosine-phosphatase
MSESRDLSTRPLNVLFLCTHNAARSILAEALLNTLGKGRFKAYSAGSEPRPDGLPHPLTLRALQHASVDTADLRSKSWDEFAGPDAPRMDLVITVCDNVAGETCPVWPGHPAVAHWGYPDPSAGQAEDEKKLEVFHQVMESMRLRLELMCNLPPEKLAHMTLQASIRELARK